MWSMRLILTVYASLGLLVPMLATAQPRTIRLESSVAFRCEPTRWAIPASYTDGLFRGSLLGVCRSLGARRDAFPEVAGLARVLREELGRRFRAEPNSTRGDQPVSSTGHRQVFSGTERLEPDLEVEQRVTLEWGGESLRLETEAIALKGEGDAGFLRGLRVVTTLVREVDGAITIRIENGLSIACPWYAPGAIFARVARGKSEEKFETSRDRILDEMRTRIALAAGVAK